MWWYGFLRRTCPTRLPKRKSGACSNFLMQMGLVFLERRPDRWPTSVSTLGVVGLSFLVATLVNPDVLLPLNRLWMRFGLLLGMIISPIVMGIIFFGLFTPMSLTMRLFRRDELRLRFKNKKTHWILRDFPDGDELSDSFKHQY